MREKEGGREREEKRCVSKRTEMEERKKEMDGVVKDRSQEG